MSGAGAGAGAGTGAADAVLLAPLTEDSFLHNLRVRFQRDLIYTYVGEALVALNPGRALPLYSAELARGYLTRPPYQLPPHVYAVAGAGVRAAVAGRGAQCVVVTGESGAGKTEAARVCLQLALLAGRGPPAPAAALLATAGTLLEAFGHAATARNHNASRFGKLLDVEFDFRGEPVGGHITHYLLEKERVSRVPAGERNYHVLYQLLAGADGALLSRLRLQRDWQRYRILRAPPAAPAAPHRAHAQQADPQQFAVTAAAMSALGFDPPECEEVWRLLAFLLKLGNVRFEPVHNIDGSLGARLRHQDELEEACELIGVSGVELAAALGAADEQPDAVGGGSGPDDEEWAEAEDDEEEEWAGARRSALLGAVYARLFTWLVQRGNARARGRGGGGGRALAVLDVYGLEDLAHNALDRLLINYAAERVQAAVTAATLRREQEEYAAEGLAWAPLPYTDHERLAELLDAGPDSVLGALRESTLRAETDAQFLQRLQQRRHPRLHVLPPHHFQVVHFGGGVTYSARGVVGANREAGAGLGRAARVLARGAGRVLGALFPAAAPGSPRRAPARGERQRALLAALLRRLPARPRLVRCVQPDDKARPRRFDADRVRHQLRTQGIVEMALLRRAGWCDSLDARDVLTRYGVLGARDEPASPASPVRAARTLLRRLPIPAAEFTFGRSRVFVRSPRAVWELEALRAARVDHLVRAAQRAWRAHAERRQRRRRARAQRVIARAWRRRAAARRAVAAAAVLRRAWCAAARRRYLRGLSAWLMAAGPRQLSPAWPVWPAPAAPRLLSRTDALLRRLHHAWRCRLYRAAFDQPARNRMREKVTCSALFRERKASYACGVAHPFVGDYVRLRASAAWRRGAAPADRYVVFADVARKGVRSARVLAVLSTHALLLLDARSLRVRRRVPAAAVYRLSLSPHADDVLVVHVQAGEANGGCLAGEGARRRGDVLLRTVHVLELATKLFLVVQNAVGAAPGVFVGERAEARLGGELVALTWVAGAGAGAAAVAGLGVGAVGAVRLERRGSRLDVLL